MNTKYKMTPKREEHLQSIKDFIANSMDKKYRRGQAEHGDNLWDNKNLIKELIDEITDLNIYLVTVLQQLEKEKL